MEPGQQINKSKFFLPASPGQRIAAGLVFLAIAVPAFWFCQLARHDAERITRCVGPCGFQQEYGLPCPTCGMTTAAIAFAQGRILKAFYIQPAAGVLCCDLIVVAFLALIIAVFGVYFRFLTRFFAEVKIRYIILAMIIVISAGWAVTLARALAE